MIYPRLLHSQWQGEWLNGSNIHYSFTIEPEIMEESIIKLLLQTIVENAVYHGLEHQESGTIKIEGTKVEKGCRQVASAFPLK